MQFKTTDISKRWHAWQINWESLSLRKSLLKHSDMMPYKEIHLGFVNTDTLLNADLQKYTFYINYAFHSKLIFITSHDLGIMWVWKNRIRCVQINCAHHKCQLKKHFFFFCFLGIHMQKSRFVPRSLFCVVCYGEEPTALLNLIFPCSVHGLSKWPSWRQTEEIYPSVNFLNEI